MPSIDDYLSEAFQSLGPKPDEEAANQAEKKRYSERLSEKLAYAFAQELRDRGMRGARPSEPGDLEGSGVRRGVQRRPILDGTACRRGREVSGQASSRPHLPKPSVEVLASQPLRIGGLDDPVGKIFDVSS